jgi:hypothetical protein
VAATTRPSGSKHLRPQLVSGVIRPVGRRDGSRARATGAGGRAVGRRSEGAYRRGRRFRSKIGVEPDMIGHLIVDGREWDPTALAQAAGWRLLHSGQPGTYAIGVTAEGIKGRCNPGTSAHGAARASACSGSSASQFLCSGGYLDHVQVVGPGRNFLRWCCGLRREPNVVTKDPLPTPLTRGAPAAHPAAVGRIRSPFNRMGPREQRSRSTPRRT